MTLPRAALRSLAITICGAACYGFAIGAGKNLTYAWRSAVKLPLLLLGTAMLCSLAWFVVARFLGTTLRFHEVQRCAWGLFRTSAVMLASLGPVAWFLGRTMDRATTNDLGGYPAFVGTNMLFVAGSGCVALALQVTTLVQCGCGESFTV